MLDNQFAYNLMSTMAKAILSNLQFHELPPLIVNSLLIPFPCAGITSCFGQGNHIHNGQLGCFSS